VKRKKLGKTINWQKTYERNITKEEKVNGSPYWAWMEKHGQQTEEGDILEFLQANPDMLNNGAVVLDNEVPVISLLEAQLALTPKQWEIMRLVLDGFSQTEIVRNLGLKQAYVSKTIKASAKRLQRYFGGEVI